MSLDPRTPVLVGAAVASQRTDDPTDAKPVLDLIAEAAERAATDAGSRDLLRSVDVILVPNGSWQLRNAARSVGDRIGNATARSVVADVGILQTTLFRRAADAIAAGQIDVALVAGGETKWRELRATIAGVTLDGNDDATTEPDERLAPHGAIISSEEVRAGLVSAVSHYAIVENALGFAEGQSPAEHAVVVSELWSRFNEVAQDNPDAWNREPMAAEWIREPSPKNRPLALPYNKWHNSQWNVDQAAALILCSVEAARRHGVPEDRWVFPHAIAESEHMVPVSQRSQLHRSAGFAVAGRQAFAAVGIGVDDVSHIDLYSCFPVAVQVQAAELGIGLERDLTITGGMAFGGGPLNNYVLQSTVAMAHVLRDDAGSTGLVTAISGIITKQGVGLWSTQPPEAGFRSIDVTDEVAAQSTIVETAVGAGDGTVAGFTVLYGDGGPTKAVVVADRRDGGRSVVTSEDPGVLDVMTTADDIGGRAVRLSDDGRFDLI